VKPNIPKVDLLIVLGSQLKYIVGRATVGPAHTHLKVMAAKKHYQMNSCPIIISGGYNFGVRYTAEEILDPPNFSFEALAKARSLPSEAETMKKCLINDGVPAEKILLEESSTTTLEQSKLCGIILARTTFSQMKTVGILTLGKHMKISMPLFEKELSAIGKEAVPIYAEDVLISSNVAHHVEYYYSDLLERKPGSVPFDLEQLEKTIVEKQSISTIL